MPTTQQMLDEAKAARHKLAIGSLRVSTGYGDRRTEYTAATAKDLDRYIAKLEAELAGRRPVRNRVRYGVPD